MEMGLEFVNQVIKITLLLAGMCFVIGLFYNLPYASGIAAGAIWGCVNLFLLKHLLQNWLMFGQRDYIKFYTISFIKFPLLYLAGYGLLSISYFPILSLLLGFSLIFVAIFLRGLRYVLIS
jgi:hypothetical protein